MEPQVIEINEKAIERLKRKIVIAENNNLKTKNKSDKAMVDDIKKWIEEEAKCYSNQWNLKTLDSLKRKK